MKNSKKKSDMENIDYTYKYARDFDENTPKLLEYLFNGGTDKEIIKKMIIQGLSLIEQKYDCSDFRIEIFTRILYGYKNIIGKEVEDNISKVLFNFPFEDMSCHSMCTWTENHQLILDVSEYLLGKMYPENIFYNNTLGKVLANNALTRMNEWCDFVFRFGFSEFGSCNYYPETLGALGNIIEFSDDDKLRDKFKIVLDLLCFDIFSSMTPDLTYNKATARAYVDNKINYYNYLKPHISSLLNNEIKINHEREACFFLMLRARDKNGKLFYELPKVFLDIFNSKEKVLKESNGLDGKEYRKNGLLKYDEKNIRYIMTSGTSGSYFALKNTIKYLDKKKMWNHSMFVHLKPYRLLVLHSSFLFHLIRKYGHNKFRDISYARGNTYTYVKNNYSVSSLTRYQVNKPSFQQVSHVINLDGLSIFTTSPANTMDKKGSPDYWIGSKINPDCMQHKNILIAYYKNPKLTHIYFPFEKFNKVNLDNINDGIIFAQYHSINLFIKTNGKLEFADSRNDNSIRQDDKTPNFNLTKYDLLNKNKGDHYYIYDIDDSMSFEEFIDSIKKEKIDIHSKSIKYKDFSYTYKKDCYYKNDKLETSYYRYESDFILDGKYTFKTSKPLIFISKNNKLKIDFNNFVRKEDIVK